MPATPGKPGQQDARDTGEAAPAPDGRGTQPEGTVDPFQDPEYLADQFPGDAQPGTGRESSPDGSAAGGNRTDAEDLEADGSGSDDPDDDGDRFDAG